MKKVLVIGGGGREHAIVYALSRSPQVEKIYCAPGNAGIAQLAECVAIKDTDVEGLLLFAKETEVDLTVVGPEAALAAGVVDAFRAEGMPIFGHTKAATQIESSKEFAKIIMDKYHVPTAGYQSFSDYAEALAYVKAGTLPTVLKYDGLAAGKGVVIATTLEEADAALQDMLCNEAFGKGKVVIEDYLEERTEVCVLEIWQNALKMGEFSKPSKKDSTEIALILQGFDGWEKQPKVKRFAEFGVQKWWRKGGTAAEEDMLPL